MSRVYAKIFFKNGRPVPETLEEHTLNLLKELDRFESIYKNEVKVDESFWDNLKLACLFHDLGKISSHFQQKLKRLLNEKEDIPKGLHKEIPHNYISGIFFYLKPVRKLIPKDSFNHILYSVLFHHDRDINFDGEYFKEVLERDISKRVNTLMWLSKYGINIEDIEPNRASFLFRKIVEFKNNEHRTIEIKKDKNFILLKGLLHRLDHSASAHLPVENERLENVEEELINFLSKKEGFTGLKPFQQKAKSLRNRSVLLIASTGMGKTEFAINWIGESKTFYTLPVRVSVNAMYERFVNIFGKDKVGLLHSNAIFYGLDQDKKEKAEDSLSIEEHILRTQTTRQLSMPITITTADQIFTSTLKYPGFEKIYATLMYSKVILDEPQSYSPDTLAIIVKGLQEISEYGGKFCFMSATIPPFVKESLESCQDLEVLEPVFNTERKHKIKLEEESIDGLIGRIISEYEKGKKVLVITNTVRKSQEIYQKIKSLSNNVNVKLLHSLFIKDHRKDKEKQIKKDYSEVKPVIWISTQLVEASLDIDYDVLFTELATLDSLIQRMGRVYRKIGRTISESDESNVYISTATPSDKGKIYDKNILSFTVEALKGFNGKVLTDEVKQKLMEEVYSKEKLKNTNFYKKFVKNLEILNLGFTADNKKDAQRLFRDISNVNVIPQELYEDKLDNIEKWIETALNRNKSYSERLKALREIDLLTI